MEYKVGVGAGVGVGSSARVMQKENAANTEDHDAEEFAGTRRRIGFHAAAFHRCAARASLRTRSTNPGMIPTPRRSRGFSYFFSIALLLLAIAAPLLVRDLKSGTEDFGHFYRAADAMRHGEDIYVATDGRYIYPPMLAFVLQPLTFLSENTAVVVWLVLSAIAIFGAAIITAKETTRSWLGEERVIAPSFCRGPSRPPPPFSPLTNCTRCSGSDKATLSCCLVSPGFCG